MLFVWPVGMPLLYLCLVVVSMKSITSRRPTYFSRACHFLHGDYAQDKRAAWEVLDLARRLSLVGILRFVPKDRLPQSRLFCGAGISIGFLFAVLLVRPHRIHVDNLLAAMVHLAVCVVLQVGYFIEAYQRAVRRGTHMPYARAICTCHMHCRWMSLPAQPTAVTCSHAA